MHGLSIITVLGMKYDKSLELSNARHRIIAKTPLMVLNWLFEDGMVKQ